MITEIKGSDLTLEAKKMMYTVQIGYKMDRLYSRTEKVLAENKEEAKKIVWGMVKKEYPEAVFSDANARKSKRVGG